MSKFLLGLAAVVAVAAAVPALAQQTAPSAPIPKGVFYKGQTQAQFLARDRLLTLSVHDASGKIIGDIEDLIIGSGNQVEGVVMGTGGFLGAGEKKVGVRLSALQISQKDGRTYIMLPAATKDVLAALQPYKRAEPKRTLMDRAKDKAQELTDKTKDSAGPAYEQAKEKAKQAYDSAREQAGPAYEQAKRTAKEAYDKAMQTARETYDKATEKAPEPASPAPKQ
jgi:ElaB/YqjD/DUF883 family membrane-anchored ribosome-binding protein